MRRSVWLWPILAALLAGALAGCGGQSDARSTGLAPRYTAVPGLQELGPLPAYRLELTLSAPERRLKGLAQVTFPNRTGERLEEIVFRLYPNLARFGGRLDVGPVWVDGQRSTSALRQENTSLAIPLARPLAPDASVTIDLTFSVEIPEPRGEYVLFGYSQGVWSVPDGYPLLAVHDGQGWREDLGPDYADASFAEAAFYDVKLTLPPTLTLVTTGSVVSQTLRAEGRQHQIVGGPLREFAWLASSDYVIAQTQAQGTTVRSYYLPGDEAAGESALGIAAAALRAYTQAFGAYPYPEMAVAEAPLDYFGMEYPGLNLIGVSLYRDQRREMENRVSHEIAHQWWYSQVGNDPIRTPWLDEGLAEQSMATYLRIVYGPGRANALVNQRWLAPYQKAVDDGFDAVVNQEAAAFGPIYEVMVYAKAALFFEALRQEVGEQTFFAILHQYLEEYRWRIATPEDFLRVAEQVSGRDLDGLYTRWILTAQ